MDVHIVNCGDCETIRDGPNVNGSQSLYTRTRPAMG